MASFPAYGPPAEREDAYTTHSEQYASLLQVSVKSLHVMSREELFYFTVEHLGRGAHRCRPHFKKF